METRTKSVTQETRETAHCMCGQPKCDSFVRYQQNRQSEMEKENNYWFLKKWGIAKTESKKQYAHNHKSLVVQNVPT